jgi:hypothetical protein
MDSSGRSSSSRTLRLDRSDDCPVIERQLRALGLDDFDIQRRGTKVPGVKKQPLRLGMRWIVETTNTWWSNYGQLRRNTDRRARHRHAALCLATTILIIASSSPTETAGARSRHLSADVLREASGNRKPPECKLRGLLSWSR